MKSISCLGLFGALLLLLAGAAEARPGYYRFPDIHGDRIVFNAEGDLWTSHVDGTEVRRITTHAGDELYPRFSPDGEWIAFAGDYDGNRDLYLIPASGGEPRRMTWHPGSDYPIGWTPDGTGILIRTYRSDPLSSGRIFVVPTDGGEPRELPIGRANLIDIDPESGRYAFTRLWGGGTWKRYRGGTAPEIWVGHPDRADYRRVTDFDGIDLFPMWHAGRIYFLSDQGGTANLWSMEPDGSNRTRHTAFDEWDAREPANGPDGRIVFTLAGAIHLFDPAVGTERVVPIDLPSEQTLARRRYADPGETLTEFALSPDGERVLVVSRGEIFSIPVEDGVTLPVTHGNGARESRVGFDPEGERVVYVTDESGEQEIVTADAWGRGDVKTVKGADRSGWHHPPVWSPDGERIAYADMTHRLYVVDADGGTPREVDRDEHSEIRWYSWSPDGRWLAYSMNNEVVYSTIYIYDTENDVRRAITDWSTDDFDPVWDPDGRYLYFLGNRTIDPLIGAFDFETISVQPTRPYMVLLREDVENPFRDVEGLPPEEEEDDGEDDGEDGEEQADDDEEDEESDEKPEPVEIDFDGIEDRVVEIPVDPGTYRGLSATAGHLFYLSLPLDGLAGDEIFADPEPTATLMRFDFEEKEATPFLRRVSGYELQPKAEKILAMKSRGALYVFGTGSPPGDDLSDARVSLDGIVLELDPREEWRQMYHEGWRFMRDFYWDEGMHGLDWEAIRDQYATLLPRIATRWDLRDVMAEMIGELSTSHTYIWGGDAGREVPRRATGLLGAAVAREGDFFRIDRIYRGAPADRIRSPLLEPGVGVAEGDYILAVNQRPFPPDLPFEAAFENLAGKRVVLTVNDAPRREGSRLVVVEPIRSERGLLYADWVRRNREHVAEKTDGKIGYLHIPDMGGRGLIEFNTWFYPQLDKEGMVVDCRWNGGGFVSQLLLARLQRHILSWDRVRWGGVYSYPYRVLNGPFVVLTNEYAGSDGDIFPAAVQLTGLAPVIGQRSWGGVVGIRGFRQLVDGGAITQPESAWWDRERGWGLEGRGVEPDIEVTNLPQELARGVDAQLERGIEEVLRLHEENPPEEPEFGPAPDRSRDAYEDDEPEGEAERE
ncbi:MAG: hypothetical protein GF346_02985 [Candidatus Eisenbacteria bacterium]|nr:hypothetical protein [Candidatus Latescibacterota bacterium]MBD3301386.1 hypothetical protein [Candidatus Eisenbacteria bacterium]